MYGLGTGSKQEGRPTVWETREVRKEMNHVGPSPFTYFLCSLLTSKMRQDMRNSLTHLTIHITMPTLTPASMFVLLPSTQPRPSVRVLASTETRSCASSAGVLCNKVVGVPRYRLPRTNASVCSSGQRKHERPNARLKRGVEKWGCSIDQTQGRRGSKDPTQGRPCPMRGRSNHNPSTDG